jgi:hypothetical protein
MPEHIQYEDDDLFNPETHHEESDVPLKPLWWALILFVVFSAITGIVLHFMYQAMLKAEIRRWDPPQTAVARPASADVPQNQPLLQPFPTVSQTPYRNTEGVVLREMRAAEDKVLKNYGWVDKQHGIVHIPIDQAKELFAAQAAATAAAQTPVVEPVATTTTTIAPTTTTATTTGGAH